jgi:hypothetical protein
MYKNKLTRLVLIGSLCLLPAPFALAQVQDVKVSVKQFTRINKAKKDVKKIKKGVTTESEISKTFGKESISWFLEEPVTKEDEQVFIDLLRKHIPAELKPEYPFPAVDQKVLIYIIPWTFEHPVPDRKGTGKKMVQTENVVVLFTIDKKTGIVEEFKSFDFYFYTPWEDSEAKH